MHDKNINGFVQPTKTAQRSDEEGPEIQILNITKRSTFVSIGTYRRGRITDKCEHLWQRMAIAFGYVAIVAFPF